MQHEHMLTWLLGALRSRVDQLETDAALEADDWPLTLEAADEGDKVGVVMKRGSAFKKFCTTHQLG